MDDKIKKGSKVSHSCLNKIQASGMRKTVATTVDKTKLRQTAAVQHSALGSRQMNPNVPSPNFTDKTERNDGGKSDNDDELTAWLADYLGKKSIGDKHSASPPVLSINKREQSTICATTGSDKFSTMNLLKRAWGKQSLCILISFHYFFLINIFVFFLLKIIELNIYWYFSAQTDPYYESLCDLQQISQKKNPYAKMRTILSAIDCIDKEVNRFYDTHPEYKRPVGRYLFVSPLFLIYFSSCFLNINLLLNWNLITWFNFTREADDLPSLLQHLIIKSNINNIHAQLFFANQFTVDSQLEGGEMEQRLDSSFLLYLFFLFSFFYWYPISFVKLVHLFFRFILFTENCRYVSKLLYDVKDVSNSLVSRMGIINSNSFF